MKWVTVVTTHTAAWTSEIGDDAVLTSHHCCEGGGCTTGNAVRTARRKSKFAASIREKHLIEVLLTKVALPVDLWSRLEVVAEVKDADTWMCTY